LNASLSRRSLLGVLASAAALGGTARGDVPAKRLVLVVSSGGWDPSFSVDPKPHVTDGGPYPDLDPTDPDDVEELVDYGTIRVSCNEARRPEIRRFFDAWADRTVVVNGLWTGSLSHWTAMDRVLTGSDGPGAPDVAAIAGSAHAADAPLGTIDLAGLSRFGDLAPSCARAGVRGQLHALLDPSVRIASPTGPRPSWHPTDADRAAISAFLDARGGRPSGSAAWAERDEARRRADALRAAADAVEQLPFGRRVDFADQVPYAVDLLASDVCRAVVVGTGFSWDTHGDASRQQGAWNGTFGGLSALASGLADAGLLDETLVVAVSELGRSPSRNEDGGTGHWPYTSALVLGGGVVGARQLGGTDDASVGLGVDLATGGPGRDPLSTGAFAAGILAALGLDPEDHLPGTIPLRGLV
jgi:uncharacterized protein (DUF1501 family)